MDRQQSKYDQMAQETQNRQDRLAMEVDKVQEQNRSTDLLTSHCKQMIDRCEAQNNEVRRKNAAIQDTLERKKAQEIDYDKDIKATRKKRKNLAERIKKIRHDLSKSLRGLKVVDFEEFKSKRLENSICVLKQLQQKDVNYTQEKYGKKGEGGYTGLFSCFKY